ncbi:MAG: prolipoprotein diacylglyceryl transferase [Candidatus Margulisbacteria bacterium]|jgi:phosphatidylglycerol:prolipoprotein diacylglycerol transferase|nr:prolipoprotein diacylglyceryl transferase [Candidatus Margulisiibacteriota bacterium]
MVKKKSLLNRFIQLPAIAFPTISPVALSLGPFNIHWYGISYCMAIGVGYVMANASVKKMSINISVSDLISNVILGVIIGGRLGYVLFYDVSYYMGQPWDIFAVWKGGMSFHGGALGAFIATILTCNRFKVPIKQGVDLLAFCVTPGLFFGRIANFINGELYGRVSLVPWAMVFPGGGTMPRHPSQLYEALLEGLGLLLFLWVILRWFYKPGRLFLCFVMGYAMVRFFVEFTREPDTQLGLLALQLSMGQYLSLIMILFGMVWAYATSRFNIS